MQDPYLMLAIAEGFGESPVAALLEPDLDPATVLAAPAESREPLDLPPRVVQRLRQPDLAAQAALLRRQAAQLGMQVLTPTDDRWPQRLSEQPMRPLVLFVRGDAGCLSHQPAAAVVGSRTPTPYGIDAADDVCAALMRCHVVLWSGLARGIDRIAHQACLRAGLPTVAVLAGGLDALYPPEHHDLAERIVADGGCLISELPPGRRSRRGHFVRRNRLLAAGPTAVVVIEGSLASGALHTARFAADCSTDIFAMPGPWRSERSQGCHRLIAEGATIIESPQALLQGLGLSQCMPGSSRGLELASEQQMILEQLREGPRPTDLLRRECALDEASFLRALFGLEAGKGIERLPGDLWRSVIQFDRPR